MYGSVARDIEVFGRSFIKNLSINWIVTIRKFEKISPNPILMSFSDAEFSSRKSSRSNHSSSLYGPNCW